MAGNVPWGTGTNGRVWHAPFASAFRGRLAAVTAVGSWALPGKIGLAVCGETRDKRSAGVGAASLFVATPEHGVFTFGAPWRPQATRALRAWSVLRSLFLPQSALLLPLLVPLLLRIRLLFCHF